MCMLINVSVRIACNMLPLRGLDKRTRSRLNRTRVLPTLMVENRHSCAKKQNSRDTSAALCNVFWSSAKWQIIEAEISVGKVGIRKRNYCNDQTNKNKDSNRYIITGSIATYKGYIVSQRRYNCSANGTAPVCTKIKERL